MRPKIGRPFAHGRPFGFGARALSTTSMTRIYGTDLVTGWTFDNMSRMYQDTAGTTPVTAVGQKVGRVLPVGVGYGPEMIAGGDFSGANPATGAYQASGAIVDGVLRVTVSPSFNGGHVFPTINTVAGKLYRVTGKVKLVSGTAAWISPQLSGSPYTTLATSSTVTDTSGFVDVACYFVALSSSTIIRLYSNGVGGVAEFDDVSCREVIGVPLLFDTAKRPTLINVPVQESDLGAEIFDGSLPFQVFRDSGTNITLAVGNVVSGQIYALDVTVSVNPGTISASIRVNNLASNAEPSPVIAAGFTGRRVYYFQAKASGPIVIAGDNTGTNLTISALSLRSVVSGKPALLFDGATTAGYTATTLDLTDTDEISVIAAVRRLSDTPQAITEFSNYSYGNSGTFGLFLGLSNSYTRVMRSNGTIPIDASSIGPAAPYTAVLIGTADISSDTLRLYADGAQEASNSADQGAGTYGDYTLYVGARNNSSSLPFNGALFGLWIAKRLSSTDDVAKATTAAARLIGDYSAPTITTSATQTVAENAQLAIALTADKAVTWSITGGADAADYEISGNTLRWVGNGTQDYEAPADADTNNTYVVQVTASTLHASTSLTITTTVTDQTESETPPAILAARWAQSEPDYTVTDPTGWDVVTVTTTDAAQTSGSIRQAIAQASGTGTFIDFDSSLPVDSDGMITFDLGSSTLSIPKPNIIIRGETAPGLVVFKSTSTPIRIEASNVQVRHVVNRVVEGIGNDNDGGQIQPRSDSPVGNLTNSGFANVLLINSTDELASAYPNNTEAGNLFTRDVTGVYYYRCIFADPVGGSGVDSFRVDGENHPKGVLFGDGGLPAIPVRNAFFAENLIISSQDRCPRFGQGAGGIVVGNYITNYQRRTYEIGLDSGKTIYADVATGLADTVDGEFFFADSGSGDLKAYKNVSGSATLMRDLPDDVWSNKVSVYGNSYWQGASAQFDLSPFEGGIRAGSQVYHANNWKNGEAWALSAADVTAAGFDPQVGSWTRAMFDETDFPHLLAAEYTPLTTLAAVEENVLLRAGPRYWEPNLLSDLKIHEAATGQGIIRDSGIWPTYDRFDAVAPTLSSNTVARYASPGTVVGTLEGIVDPGIIPTISGTHAAYFELDASGRTLMLAQSVATLGNSSTNADLSISIDIDSYSQNPRVSSTPLTVTVQADVDAKTFAALIAACPSIKRAWTADSGVTESGGVISAFADRVAGQSIPAVGSPVVVADASAIGISNPMLRMPTIADGLKTASMAMPADVPGGSSKMWVIVLAHNPDTLNSGAEGAIFQYGNSSTGQIRGIDKAIAAGGQRPKAMRGITQGSTFNAGSMDGVSAVAMCFDNANDKAYCYIDNAEVNGGDAFAGTGGTAITLSDIGSTGIRFAIGMNANSSATLGFAGGGLAAALICDATLNAAALADIFRSLAAYRAGAI